MRYFIYCRKSSEAEDRQILSIESQLSTLQRAFGERSEVDIVAIYEEAFSAKAPGRQKFDEMLSRIERGDAQGIIAWAPDRLARNSIDGGRVVFLLDRGVIHDLKFSTYTFENNPQGKFMLQIMFGQSKYYSDALSENVKRGNLTKVEKGWRPNQPPLGYLNDKETRTIVPDPERFALVRKMFDLALTGAYSTKQIWKIARDELGLRTIKRKRIGGKPLALGAVHKILTNPFYAGVLIWVRKAYPGAHKPMITMDELKRVQSLRSRPDKPKPKTREFPFTGMIHCGECGLLVTAEEKVNRYGSKYTYYHCSKRRLDVRCRQRCIRVEDLEQQLCGFLANLSIGPRIHQWALEQVRGTSADHIELKRRQIEAIERAIADNQCALSNLTSIRLRDLIADDEFVRERQKLDLEKIRLEQQAQELKASHSTFEPAEAIVSLCNRAIDWFRAADSAEKRLIVELLGSNPVLKDKILFIEAKKPFQLIANSNTYPELRAAVDHIRTLYAARDPEMMEILDGIKKLGTIARIPFAEVDRRAA